VNLAQHSLLDVSQTVLRRFRHSEDEAD